MTDEKSPKLAPLFLNDLSNETEATILERLASEFSTSVDSLGVCRVLVADICEESYEGDAFVLFVGNDGELYEVNGSHCSCYGFEGQWEPKKTTGKYLVSEHFPGRQDGELSERIRELFNAKGELVR